MPKRLRGQWFGFTRDASGLRCEALIAISPGGNQPVAQNVPSDQEPSFGIRTDVEISQKTQIAAISTAGRTKPHKCRVTSP